jgi:hypothetical protein
MEIKELRKGSDYDLTFNLVNPDGSPKDLTGTVSLTATISEYFWSTPVLTINADITDPENGGMSVKLSQEDLDTLKSRVYHLEVQHENALNQNINLLVYAISIL